ncbi:hypothetical protein VE00_07458 [Pseudogymnoascus sp. WSF 3629]|nr:hypothetical protein VE00_07458 [Pseudogymnoascus sp. WSF 3629]
MTYTTAASDILHYNKTLCDWDVTDSLFAASWVDKHLSDRIQSPHLRAPEVTLGAPWGTGVDIWSFGCLIIEFVKGHLSFPGTASRNGTWTAEDDRLAQLMEVFVPFPKALLERGARSKEFFDDEGNLLRIPKLLPASLLSLMDGENEVLRRPKDMPKAEVPVFVDFLENVLAIRPDNRKSAAEMLKHPWLVPETVLTASPDRS